MEGLIQGVGTVAEKDRQSVTRAGGRVAQTVHDVEFRPATTQIDERGSLVEVLTIGEGSLESPVVHVYRATVRPGRVKGWVVHLRQNDRLFFTNGTAKVGLYDARAGSPTEGVIDVRYVGNENRGLLVIPAGVYHAVRNVGLDELGFINMPTRAYDHAEPDKHRLPADTTMIPYEI
jgi:dTDP-4-dehydrorhamnose 3,5-epimerase